MAPICTNCGHSKTDHLTGKCVNRTMRFDAASGAVVNVCGCKKLDVAAAASIVPAVDEAAATEPETETAGTAPAVLTTDHEPPNETTTRRRRK